MPSVDQIKELRNNCSWKWTNLNGTNGHLVTGLNGGTIFLPAAGHRNYSSIYDRGAYGGYWSSSLGPYDEGSAFSLSFGSDYWNWGNYGRYDGFTVRAICGLSSSLSLSQYDVKLAVGGSTIIDITDGSGNYSVTTDNTNMVKATLSDSNILIKALEAGSATITVEDLGLNQKATISVQITGNSNPTYPVAEAIDLGLPSGTKWASWNVGATKPEEYGCYYAWGEIEERVDYNWGTYTHCDDSSYNCHDIGDDIAGTQYDVAHMKWGGSWRIPSKDQIKELIDKCTKKWINKNGVNGNLFTGPNGNSIFLPAAGEYMNDELIDKESNGYYWSSSLYPDFDNWAYFLDFYSGYSFLLEFGPRPDGFTVRPVCK